MYERFFSLRERPFSDRLDTRAFHSTPDREEALAALQCAAEYAPGHVLILGESGTGKSLLMRVFVSRFAHAERVQLLDPAVRDGDVFGALAQRLGVALSHRGKGERSAARLERQLARLAAEGRAPIVVIEQAERLTAEQLRRIEILTDWRHADRRLLSVVLVGQPTVLAALEQPEMRRLRQIFHQPIRILPIAGNAMPDYLRRGLEAVGGGGGSLFSPEAMGRIHGAARGVPRLINQIADAALCAAYGAGCAGVDADIVEDIVSDDAGCSAAAVASSKWAGTTGALPSSEAASEIKESGEPFDWSAALPPVAGAVLYPPWDEEEDGSKRGDALFAARRDAEMVSIACAGVGTDRAVLEPPMDDAPVAATVMALQPETSAVDLLERLEKAVDLFGLPEPPIVSMPLREHESRAPVVEAQALMVESLDSRLHATLSRAEVRIAELERRVVRLDQPLSEIEDKRARWERMLEGADQAEGRLAEYAAHLVAAAEQLHHRAAALQQDQEQCAAERARLAEALEHVEQAGRRLDDRLEQHRQAESQLDDRAAERRRALGEALDEARETRAALEQWIVRTNEDHAGAAARMERLQNEWSEAASRTEADFRRRQESWVSAAAAEHDQAVQAWREQVKILRSQGAREISEARQRHEESMKSAAEHLATLRGEAEALIRETQAQVDRAAAGQRAAVEAILVEAGARHEQMRVRVEETVRGSREELDALEGRRAAISPHVAAMGAQLEEVAARLDQVQRQRDAVLRGLSTARTDMDHLMERGREMDQRLHEVLRETGEAAASAQNVHGRLESSHRAATQLLMDIAACGERLHSWKEQLSQGEELSARLGDQLEAAAPIVRQLPEEARAARDCGETLVRLTAAARDEIARSESHRAAAATARRQLSDVTVAAHDAMEELRKVQVTARESMEGLLARVEPTQRACEARMAQIEQAVERAALLAERESETTEQLTSLHDSAAQAADALKQTVDSAQHAASDLSRQTAQAESATQRLAALRAGLDETQNLMESAGRLEERLRDAATDFQSMIEKTSAAAAAHGPTLTAYLEQTTQLAHCVEDLKQQAQQLDAEVRQALDKPQHTLHAAAEQTAHLESVCAAVRKVFANLAQTSLQARKDIQAFERRSAETAEQSTRLTAETNRAAATLQQWVQEAIHVQARLEQTLKQAPPLDQTHPGEILKSVSRLAAPILGAPPAAPSPSARPVTADGGVEPLPDDGRATQIAAILHDARRARTGANRS